VSFPALAQPIVGAPLAGGPSTPELAAAVSNAGGLGFLAAGYLTPDTVAGQIARVQELTEDRYGLNIFCLADRTVDPDALERYAESLEADARALGAELGTPHFEDDAFEAKIELALREAPDVVSFTFGCPSGEVIGRLRDAGIAVWVTVTDVAEAVFADLRGADALVVQGAEAGGHRASFADVAGIGELGLLPLLRLTARATTLPLVAAGGIADGAGVAAVLAGGAAAAQVGTAFMRSPEAGTSATHREALALPGATQVTRAFTGRRARGIVNRFMEEHDAQAPAAYPQVHHLTAPLRAAARAGGDADAINLWAGEAYPLGREESAGDLVRRLGAEARAALAGVEERWAGSAGPNTAG
jgi:nitronate monooxygenase